MVLESSISLGNVFARTIWTKLISFFTCLVRAQGATHTHTKIRWTWPFRYHQHGESLTNLLIMSLLHNVTLPAVRTLHTKVILIDLTYICTRFGHLRWVKSCFGTKWSPLPSTACNICTEITYNLHVDYHFPNRGFAAACTCYVVLTKHLFLCLLFANVLCFTPVPNGIKSCN